MTLDLNLCLKYGFNLFRYATTKTHSIATKLYTGSYKNS